MAGREEVLAAVSKLSASLKQMVEDGRANYKKSGDINDFVHSRGADHMHGLLTVYPVQLYADCFKTLGVETRASLESLWAQHCGHPDIQEAVEDLLGAEEGYREFIGELDQIMNAHEEEIALPVVSKGECLNADVSFVCGASGDTVSLNSLLEKSKYTLFILRKHYV